MAKRVLEQHLPEHFQRKASLCWGPGLLQQPGCPQTEPKGTTPWALHCQSYPRWLLPAGAVPCYLWLLCQHTEVQLLNPGGCLSFTGDVHPLSQSSQAPPWFPAPTSSALGTTIHILSYSRHKASGLLFVPFNVIDCHQGASELLQCIPVPLS